MIIQNKTWVEWEHNRITSWVPTSNINIKLITVSLPNMIILLFLLLPLGSIRFQECAHVSSTTQSDHDDGAIHSPSVSHSQGEHHAAWLATISFHNSVSGTDLSTWLHWHDNISLSTHTSILIRWRDQGSARPSVCACPPLPRLRSMIW